MQLIRGLHNIRSEDHGCVLTIGNFDGVHLGHRRVIEALVAKAKLLALPATVMIFEPQPQEFFLPKQAPARLTRFRDKYNLLKKLGVERLLCINFNSKFASMSAEAFIEQLLVMRLGTKHLIIGDDFRFGKNRQGDFKLLKEASNKFSFGLSDTKSYKLANCRISSTAIRQALEHDELELAAKMLGRPYAISGRVVHGDKQGRKLGFPTANVLLKRRVSPVSGVYVVEVCGCKDKPEQRLFGVANIGSRPTVAGIRQQLEVYIFNFDGNLYGHAIEVILVKKIRNEQRFESLAALTAQIALDSQAAKTYLQQLHNL
jgi:riboflavin kinase/FMN adenylyltransferase